jgi:hypothetical protein
LTPVQVISFAAALGAHNRSIGHNQLIRLRAENTPPPAPPPPLPDIIAEDFELGPHLLLDLNTCATVPTNAINVSDLGDGVEVLASLVSTSANSDRMTLFVNGLNMGFQSTVSNNDLVQIRLCGANLLVDPYTCTSAPINAINVSDLVEAVNVSVSLLSSVANSDHVTLVVNNSMVGSQYTVDNNDLLQIKVCSTASYASSENFTLSYGNHVDEVMVTSHLAPPF